MFARMETSNRKDNSSTFSRPCPQRYYNTMAMHLLKQQKLRQNKASMHNCKRYIIKSRKKYIVIVTGDLSAQVGNDNLGFEEVIGKHRHGRMNENGELWCATNEMVIGGTLFPHKRIIQFLGYHQIKGHKTKLTTSQ
jgi:hypothetical protein